MVIADCFVLFLVAAVHVAVVAVLSVAVADYKNVASVSVSNSSKHQPAKNVYKVLFKEH